MISTELNLVLFKINISFNDTIKSYLIMSCNYTCQFKLPLLYTKQQSNILKLIPASKDPLNILPKYSTFQQIINRMRKSQSKRKDKPIKSVKEQQEYAEFLQKKLQEEKYLSHLIDIDVQALVKENQQLRQTIVKLRSGWKKCQQKNQELQNQNAELKQSITQLQQRNLTLNQKIKNLQKQNSKSVNITEPLETKIIFKQFLNNTFPNYKDTIKRILRFFMYIEKYEQKGKQSRIKTYNSFIKSIVEKLMLFIFPKKSQQQTHKSIALSMLEKWKSNESLTEKELHKQVVELKDKEVSYIKQVQSCEAEILRLKAAKSVLQNKNLTYEKTLKVKASQFVVHFKKALVNKSQYGEEDEAIGQMNEILVVLQSVVERPNEEPQTLKVVQKDKFSDLIGLSNKSLPVMDADMGAQNIPRGITKGKKQAPLLKKNIYGYYLQPQLSTQWNFLTSTRHPDLNKYTQTLPDDLTVLIAHPVLLLHLFDGTIKPQRTRHNTEFYVKIHKNAQTFIESPSIDSLDYKPVWDRQYLIKGYDFPSLRVELMNKSKGLRDKSLGEGKLTVESCESKMVNIKKQKQHQGRVRFGIHYPKGNIFEYVINSVQLIVPEGTKILTQMVQISLLLNEPIISKFSNSTLINYFTNKSLLIIQGYEGSITGTVTSRKVSGTVGLKQFTEKQGSKTVVIQADEWQIILEGYVVLIVSEQSEPERIKCLEEDRFIAVRAGHPLVSASYGEQTLYSHVKWPLVFKYLDELPLLSCVLQSQKMKGKTEEVVINPIIKPQTQFQIVKNQLLSTPPHIYQFFIQSLQGPQVNFSYQSHFYVKLPQKIKLQINLDLENDQNQKLNPFIQKGKRALKQTHLQKIQWFVETKDLMCNFYQLMNKTYKVTGYTKFKLGFCKVRNILTTQGKQPLRKTLVKKNVQIDEPFEGEYYTQFTISKAYLPSFSSTAKFSVKITSQYATQQTDFIHGSLVQWNHQVLIKLKFVKDKVTYLTVNICEKPLIGSEKNVYEAQIPIAANIFKLGRLVLNLGEINNNKKQLKDQDILILDGFMIPNCVYSLLVSDIEIEVEQKADWFSKIDPYLIFYANDRKVYQTKVMDDAGDNALWQNINLKLVVPETAQVMNQNFELFQCRIFDEDLISDDYLGTCSVSYDKQLAGDKSQLDCIRASINKEEKFCGGMKLHGKFKRIQQQPNNIVSHAFSKLDSEKHMVCQVCLTELTLIKKEDLDWEVEIQVSALFPASYKQIQAKINPKNLTNCNFSVWLVSGLNQDSKIEINLSQKKKNFFKTEIIHVGSFQISSEFIFSQSIICHIQIPILNQRDPSKQIGFAKMFVQPIFDAPYCVIDAYTSASRLHLLSQTQQDSLTLQLINSQHLLPLMPNFHDMYLFSDPNCILHSSQKIQFREVPVPSSLNPCVKRIAYETQNQKFPLNNQVLTVFSIHKTQSDTLTPLLYKRTLAIDENQFLRSHPVSKQSTKLYKIKVLHWQPVKFEASKIINVKVNFQHRNEANIIIKNQLNEVYNSYYAFSSSDEWQNKTLPMIFSEHMLPQSLTINFSNKSQQSQQIVIDLHESLNGQRGQSINHNKHVYLQDHGALYYELEEYKLKYRRVVFSGIYVKVSAPQIINLYPEGLNGVCLGLTESEIMYQSRKRIGKNGFFFQNIEFYVPADNAHNRVSMKIELQNGHRIEVPLKGKLNKWDYIYQSNHQLKLHCSMVIESDISQGCISLQRKPPTLVSFLQIQSIKLSPSERLPDTQLSIKFSLHNQHISLKAVKNQSEEKYYEMNEKELVYVYEGKESVVKVQIVEEKIFGTKVLGWCNILIKEDELYLADNIIIGQVRNQKSITLGKVEFRYRALPTVKYLYVDIDKIVPKLPYESLIVELVPFGSDKSKIQRIQMRQTTKTTQNNTRHAPPSEPVYDTSQDLIVCEQDYQDYSIHVSVKQTNQLIGKFKLCNLIKRQNDNDYEFISAVHPLKVDKKNLNGLVGINYIEYVCHKEIDKSLKPSSRIVKVFLKKWRFWNQKRQPQVALVLTTTNRKLFSDKILLNFNDQTTAVEFILPQNQKFTITLQKGLLPKAFAVIDPKNFSHKNEELIVFGHFTQFKQVYAVCMMEIESLNPGVSVFELEDVTANNLEDMELFTKMNPYIVAEPVNNQIQQKLSNRGKVFNRWRTELAQGDTNLFWKMGLLFDKSIRLSVFDKDMKFDDYIGETIIDVNQLSAKMAQTQSTLLKIGLTIKSVEQKNKQTGNLVFNARKATHFVSTKELTPLDNISVSLRQTYLNWLLLTCFNESILSEGQSLHSFSILLMDLSNGVCNCIMRMESPFHPQNNCKMDIIRNIIKNGIRLDPFVIDLEGSNTKNISLIVEVCLCVSNSHNQKKAQFKVLQQSAKLSELHQSFTQVNFSDRKLNQNPIGTNIFKAIDLVPLKPTHQQQETIFLMKKLVVWYDFACFLQRVQLVIQITNVLDSKTRQYSCLIDLQSLDPKAGFSYFDFEIIKYLKHQIWVKGDETVKVQLRYANQQQQISVFKLANENQIINSQRFFIESNILSENISMNVGKLFIELEKTALVSSKEQQYKKKINKLKDADEPKQSDLYWLEMKIKSASFFQDIQLFSKMDPYCQIQCYSSQNGRQIMTQKHKTSVQQNKGKQPVWDETFYFTFRDRSQIKKIKFTFMDEELTIDRQIGYGELEINPNQLSLKDSNKFQLKIVENSESKVQKGTFKFECKLTRTFIIFTSLKSRSGTKKQPKLTINYQGKTQNEKQQIMLLKPYPVSSLNELKFFIDKKQETTISWTKINLSAQKKTLNIGQQIQLLYDLYY